MARFDRYMLSQLLWVFGFFSLVLVTIYWINRAVVLFDQLIANGQSAFVFLEFTALSLPNVIRVVLPVSAFAAGLYVTNRMANESELVVVQATGYSPWRLARPMIVFGLFVALLISVLVHVLVPASTGKLEKRTAEVSENLTARLLSDGAFLTPASGVTFYIRDIDASGALRDIFLSDARKSSERTDYTAERALLLRSESGPKLLMFQGLVQRLDLATDRLAVTRFEEFAFDIADLVDIPGVGARGVRQLSTPELLFPTPELVVETGQTMAALRYDGNARFGDALIGAVTPVIGFAIMLLGGFSRFGLWKQMVGAIICLILIQLLDNAITDAARGAGLWPLAYVPALSGFAIAAVALGASARPGLLKRTRTATP
ncbi:LPS export ABC transporter permease LptF [Oceaniglobus indicus]|uniref:LPS export ABC transporter permease LptF n=1 Tax=Oceaniglobus indicus TaxID=2047749 RepID=UPI000C186467|nr:LPS export ABC transporter permease LptF [Oceaniglobus indicus]